MLSTYAANLLLDAMYGNQNFPPSLNTTAPITPGATPSLYVALLTAMPTARDGTGLVEVSGSAYTRAAVLQNTTNWPAAAAGAKANGTTVTFPTATGSWGTIVGAAIYDAATGGNLLDYGALTAPTAVASGDTFTIAPGGIAIAR